MNWPALTICTLLLFFASQTIAEERAPAELGVQISTWITQLGSEDYAIRSAAYQALLKTGKSATDALRKGADSKDPETRESCSRLLKAIPWVAFHQFLNSKWADIKAEPQALETDLLKKFFPNHHFFVLNSTEEKFGGYRVKFACREFEEPIVLKEDNGTRLKNSLRLNDATDASAAVVEVTRREKVVLATEKDALDFYTAIQPLYWVLWESDALPVVKSERRWVVGKEKRRWFFDVDEAGKLVRIELKEGAD